jgi:hypothetical protein
MRMGTALGSLSARSNRTVPSFVIACLAPLLTALWTAPGLAAHGDYAEAMRVRALIERAEPVATPMAAETVRLPVSRGFHQLDTQLCWSYATLNALETNWRVKHPDATLELSRRAMQYLTMQDRYVRQITDVEDYISERGVAVDALRLLTDSGLVAFDDYPDIADAYGSYDIAAAVAAARGEAAKVAALNAGMDRVYGALPEATHIEERPATRAELAATVLDGEAWESYAIARSGDEGYRTHPDPDARSGARSWFMPVERFAPRIRAALESGHAVEITIGGHCVVIYGATYDAAGQPQTYFVKDSYPDYFYEASPRELMRNLVEMTTVRLDGWN